MKKMFKIFWIIISAVIIFSLPVQSQAMSKTNKKAHAAFQKQLKKDKRTFCDNIKTKLKYAYRDVDGDKVDELIIYPGYGYCSQVIYDYRRGKVKNVCGVGHGTFTKYYPKKKVISVKNSGHMGVLRDCYYKWKNGTYKLAALALKDYGTRSYSEKPVSTIYYINDKETTKLRYNTYIKRLIKKDSGKKFSGIKWKYY
ncbi:MAG: hypothetical protein UDG86_15295 [Lachnospiraceae bacterium]|nr:hypothetical protein [Lachnospiraceae bacterium]